MRRRPAAIFLVLTTVVSGTLTGATPAYALDYNPNCFSDSTAPPEIICLRTDTGNREIKSIDRTVNGAGVPSSTTSRESASSAAAAPGTRSAIPSSSATARLAREAPRSDVWAR